jgi:predicted O-methyltransferase YrrM
MVDLTKALAIDGWMSEPELRWLAEQAEKHNQIVEIGSWMGRTTRALADNARGTVYAVDTWKGSAETEQFLKDKAPGELFQIFARNLADHIQSLKVRPMPSASLTIAGFFAQAGFRFDMIFIDAAHDYENVKNDILAWRPLLAEHGLFCGHDYDLGYPGVVQAVRELIAPVPSQAAGGSSIWYKQF